MSRVNRRLRVLVGGPIVNAIKDEQFDPRLRSLVSSILSTLEGQGHEVFSAHRTEDYGSDSDNSDGKDVATRDFAWMQACDAFVAVLPAADGGLLRTDGTHIELGWASAFGKPIFAVGPVPLPPVSGRLLRGLGAFADLVFLDIDAVERQPWRLLEALNGRFQLGATKLGYESTT